MKPYIYFVTEMVDNEELLVKDVSIIMSTDADRAKIKIATGLGINKPENIINLDNITIYIRAWDNLGNFTITTPSYYGSLTTGNTAGKIQTYTTIN